MRSPRPAVAALATFMDRVMRPKGPEIMSTRDRVANTEKTSMLKPCFSRCDAGSYG